MPDGNVKVYCFLLNLTPLVVARVTWRRHLRIYWDRSDPGLSTHLVWDSTSVQYGGIYARLSRIIPNTGVLRRLNGASSVETTRKEALFARSISSFGFLIISDDGYSPVWPCPLDMHVGNPHLRILPWPKWACRSFPLNIALVEIGRYY